MHFSVLTPALCQSSSLVGAFPFSLLNVLSARSLERGLHQPQHDERCAKHGCCSKGSATSNSNAQEAGSLFGHTHTATAMKLSSLLLKMRIQMQIKMLEELQTAGVCQTNPQGRRGLFSVSRVTPKYNFWGSTFREDTCMPSQEPDRYHVGAANLSKVMKTD